MTFPVNKDNVAFGPVCLVTGGSGFVGRMLVERLLEFGLQVRAFDVVEPNLTHPNLTTIVGDIQRPEDVERAMRGVNTIFHTAAVICLLGKYKPEVRKRVYGINVGGTENLLSAARAAGVGQFIYTSSHNVSMDREMEGLDETVGYAKTYIDLYTETKVIAERAVLAANSDNFGTAAVRPGGIWGPGTRSVMLNKTLDEVANGRFVLLIGGRNVKTDCTHAQNVCDAKILAAQKLAEGDRRVGGQAYFINDGEPMNQFLWFRPLIERLGYRFPKLTMSAAPLAAVAAGLEWAHFLGLIDEPPLTRSAMWKLGHNYYHSIAKARRELGYEPRKTRDNSLEEILPFAREHIAAVKAKA